MPKVWITLHDISFSTIIIWWEISIIIKNTCRNVRKLRFAAISFVISLRERMQLLTPTSNTSTLHCRIKSVYFTVSFRFFNPAWLCINEKRRWCASGTGLWWRVHSSHAPVASSQRIIRDAGFRFILEAVRPLRTRLPSRIYRPSESRTSPYNPFMISVPT